jgi:crotonobetainyl-CoA:carnitine CoA-transferase CaiB-like acyl-CoA transferase
VYPTADGSEVVIAGNADSVFGRLCDAMGRPELRTDERYATHGARGVNMDELDALIGAWTATLPAAELLERLEANGVPAGQIFTAREMLTDPQYLAREMVQRHLSYQGWEVPMNGIVPRFTRTPGAVRHTGQPLGHDTETVLREVAGCTQDEIDELTKAGLI